MPVLLRRGVIAAVALAALAALLPVGFPEGLFITDGFLLAVLVGDWLLAVRPSDVRVERILPASAPLGQPVALSWRISGSKRRRIKVHIADQLAPSLGAGSRRIQTVLGRDEVAIVGTSLEPERRGDFVLNDLVVRTEGPLGLAARQATRHVEGRIRVVPSFRSRREAELRMNRARILEVGIRSARFQGGGSDFDRLRDYTSDDESRRIDWAATARAGRPIVRTYRAERNQFVTVLLDTGRLMAARIDGVPRLEHAMDAAMTIAAIAGRLGDRVGLVAFDSQVRAVVPHGEPGGQLRRIVDAIYRLEPALVESDFRRAFVETVTRYRRRSLFIVVTDLADQAIEYSLVGALPVVLRSHLVVVASVRDPQLDGWATARPAAAETAYRHAAALEEIDRRRRLAARLSGLGANVIDDTPARFAAHLADFYLDVKATGRL